MCDAGFAAQSTIEPAGIPNRLESYVGESPYDFVGFRQVQVRETVGTTAFLDSTRDALRHIIERAVARGKARKEPSLLPRIGMANDAVDKVRRGEPKRLLKDGDDRLKGSKYFWLTSLENHSEKQNARFSVHLQSNARYRASMVLQRALARSQGSGDGG